MPIGDPGQEQFRDLITEIRNHDVAAALRPLIELRYEIVHAEDLKSRGGVDNASRNHFLELLQDCDRWRRRVTHNPEPKPLDDLVADAADVTKELGEGENPFGHDDIQMGATHLFPLPWDFSGADSNIPLTSQLVLGGFGQILLLGVDTAIVAWTRLESRNRSHSITGKDSQRIYGLYQRLYSGLVTFGGDENQIDIAQVLATDEPRGPDNAPNRVTETATGSSSR